MILKTTLMNSFKRLEGFFLVFLKLLNNVYKNSKDAPERRTEIQSAKGRRNEGMRE